MGDARRYTNHLLDLIHDGAVDKDYVIHACVGYMSEDDVKDMMEYNNIIRADELDNNEEEE